MGYKHSTEGSGPTALKIRLQHIFPDVLPAGAATVEKIGSLPGLHHDAVALPHVQESHATPTIKISCEQTNQ